MIDMILQLQAHPIFGIVVTVLAYWAATALWRRNGQPSLLHPVLVASAMLGGVLIITGMEYQEYFHQTSLITEALSVIIVLLAVPLYRQFRLICEARTPLVFALVMGSVAAILSALIVPGLSGAAPEVIATLAPKSTTAAVAVEISDRLGGIAGLTAVIVISTGIFGAAFGPAILSNLGIRDDRAAGFALGVASHAIGTARAFQISETAGAFASLGMILNALLTIALVPIAFEILS